MSLTNLPALLRDYVEPCREEGVTYTANPAATLWPVLVVSRHAPPLRCQIKALSVDQAVAFAAKRHPYATRITVEETPNMMKPVRYLGPLDDALLEQAQGLVDNGMTWPEAHKAANVPAAIAPGTLRKRCLAHKNRTHDRAIEATIKAPSKAKPKPVAKPAPVVDPVADLLPTLLEAFAKALHAEAAKLRS